MKIVSLASTNITINNTNRGDIISFGGAGKMIGEVKYDFAEEMFNIENAPDGGYAFGHNAAKNGTVSIQFLQTCPHIDTLIEYFLWCRDNPELAAAGITITDSTGVIDMEAKNCLPVKIPENVVGSSPANRTFEFICGEILPKEYLRGGNN